MGYIHPAIAFLAFSLSLYVLYLGAIRFSAVHLGKKAPFLWKRHVLLGSVALGMWGVTIISGFAGAQALWGMTFVTGFHADAGILLLLFILFGYASGHVLDRHKKKRQLVPLLHGLINVTLVIITLLQCISGWSLLQAL